MTISKQHELPIYVQIKELLLREIGAGRWLRGERLPTESALAKQLQVAVGTLRKSLAVLEAEGVLERRQGSGTYVAEGHKGQSIYHFFRLEKRQGAAGLPSAQVFDLALAVDEVAAQALALSPETLFWHIYRRRCLDQVVIAVEEILLPQIYAPQLTQAFLHESLYLYYREHLGFWITQVTDAITLAALPAWGAEHLACEAGDICGYIERIAKNQRGERVEFSRTWFDTRQACYMARWS